MNQVKSRPNVVFILTDDQGYWSLGCYGNPEAKTPNLDRIAETGWRFNSFFCASPVCSPARASLITGKIPSQHGVHDWLCAGSTREQDHERFGNGEAIEYLRDHIGYTDLLAQNGYRCGISGKWHLGDSHTPQKSFDYWEVHAKGGGPYYKAPMMHDGEIYIADGYVTDLITDNALQFLEQQKCSDTPFYLSVHYTAPHSPWDRGNHPEEVFDDFHSNCEFSSVPWGLKPAEWIEKLAIPVENEEKRRINLSGYFAAIAEMDRNVGRILEWLEENNLRDNTLICFTSDNGMNMGHHGVFGKGNATFPINMYEESVKTPFLMSHPARLKPGIVCDELLSHYDFMPTLLDYVGIQVSKEEAPPGCSFVPVLEGVPCETRKNVVVYDEYGPVRMVRNKDWKYIHRYPYGPNELYHLAEDPGETLNLINSEEHQDQITEMKGQLDSWFNKYVDPAVDGSKEAVTGRGQKGWCGLKSQGKNNFMPLM